MVGVPFVMKPLVLAVRPLVVYLAGIITFPLAKPVVRGAVKGSVKGGVRVRQLAEEAAAEKELSSSHTADAPPVVVKK